MEGGSGYGAIVGAMRPEEREEMLRLLFGAVAGEMAAGAGSRSRPASRCTTARAR